MSKESHRAMNTQWKQTQYIQFCHEGEIIQVLRESLDCISVDVNRIHGKIIFYHSNEKK
jgi:hypothetical protein